MKPEQFIREYGLNTFKISMSFVNTAKYLVVHEGEIDFTDEIKPHHGKCVFERSVVNRLIKHLGIIDDLNGIKGAKATLKELKEMGMDEFEHRWIDGWRCSKRQLKLAIGTYESIYGDDHE
ncbi:hypothetical protein NQ624_08520 [Acinetobacter baumannii]|nr:hypothetical protein [Acinetobacter baumannii]